ncbi:MAG: O-antigen ligase family protein, partial [Blastocatellia bacterium]
MTSLPKTWAVLVCLAICGGFAAVVLLSVSLPLAPILRLMLLASFWLYMEINLFPILKNHAEPPGLNISLMLILSLLLGGAWLMERWQRNEREPVFPRAFALTLAGVLLWCSLTVAYGAEGMLGIYGLWTTAASILMCFVVTAHFNDRRVLHQMLVILAVIIALNAIFGIAQALLPSLADFAVGDKIEEPPVMVGGEEVSRAHALSGQPNSFAWNLVVFLPIVIAPLLLRVTGFSRRQRALFVVTVGLAIIALILTYSRGSWIAFAASVPLMAVSAFFILKADERRRLIFKFAGVAVMIGLLAIPFSGKIVSRLTDDDRGSAEVRLPLIQVALAMIADNPVLG